MYQSSQICICVLVQSIKVDVVQWEQKRCCRESNAIPQEYIHFSGKNTYTAPQNCGERKCIFFENFHFFIVENAKCTLVFSVGGLLRRTRRFWKEKEELYKPINLDNRFLSIFFWRLNFRKRRWTLWNSFSQFSKF